jgi:hypothetical protein
MPKRVDVELPIKRAEPSVAGMWWLSLGLAGAVVGVVAALLGAIVQTARKIDEHAAAIWTVGKQIAGNTVSIWMLEKTNEQASKMVESLRRIEQSAASIDEKLATLARSDGRRKSEP